jgi:predicted CopG family antitoxin
MVKISVWKILNTFKYTYYMAHKTLTISEKAYRALKRLKREGESFSDVILRITRRTDLVEFIESTEFLPELADKIEEVYKARETIKGRNFRL